MRVRRRGEWQTSKRQSEDEERPRTRRARATQDKELNEEDKSTTSRSKSTTAGCLRSSHTHTIKSNQGGPVLICRRDKREIQSCSFPKRKQLPVLCCAYCSPLFNGELSDSWRAACFALVTMCVELHKVIRLAREKKARGKAVAAAA